MKRIDTQNLFINSSSSLLFLLKKGKKDSQRNSARKGMGRDVQRFPAADTLYLHGTIETSQVSKWIQVDVYDDGSLFL